ncbi:hypothetical protein GCM10007972_01520 [Iodidimonas muriae]|uniref:Uncharacterized protein n=2 Tax=Iodidimonas muriae TaxID=261467 RepID=A0ABQ2L688_9PROT|nr:hypothetical protein JCM17843_07560 [Kordiimonadales bacterium JCM 17843]GGO04808.1 hypothetical protein GCM10007972_01520 [Iodidimonas muriae]
MCANKLEMTKSLMRVRYALEALNDQDQEAVVQLLEQTAQKKSQNRAPLMNDGRDVYFCSRCGGYHPRQRHLGLKN